MPKHTLTSGYISTEKMTKKRLLVFTGAGFSKSIADGIPTTKDLYDKHIVDNPNVVAIDYFNALLGGEVDIETLARKMRNVEVSASHLSRPDDYIRMHGLGYDTGDMVSSMLRENLSKALDYINDLALEKLDCTSLDSLGRGVQKNIRQTKKFLNDLCEKFDFNIFTTNYDNLIRHIQDDRDYYLENKEGLSLPTVNIAKLVNAGKSYSYIPLKGMLDWRQEGDSIVQGYRRNNGIDDAVIMQFQNVFDSKDSPHKEFYEKFDKDLSTAELLLFVGFSFRDRYINDLLKEHSSSFRRVITVTKLSDKNEIDKFKKLTESIFSGSESGGFRTRIHNMHGGFDVGAQAKILKTLKVTF